MSAPYYVFTKTRREFGRHCAFVDAPGEMLADVRPDAALGAEFVDRSPCSTSVQVGPEYSEHEANTQQILSRTQGMSHTEGGWPKDVDCTEAEHVIRFRRKIEKDEDYVRSIVTLGCQVESLIKENNSIDIYEDYFSGALADHSSEQPYARTLTVFRDPSAVKRSASYLSWFPDASGARKVAVAYSIMHFQQQPEGMPCSSYIWDVNNPNTPDFELRAGSQLCCVNYNPKDSNVLLGGMYNGQVAYWDTRKGHTPCDSSPIERSHRDPVYDCAWLQSKTGSECCSVSTDGYVHWWDTRRLSEPVESLQLMERGQSTVLGAVSLEYQEAAKFMVGTEQGLMLSCNRKAKTPGERIGASFAGHHGPVYALRRHPFFPKFFLSVGDWTARVWMEDLRAPVMTTRYHTSNLTGGAWSPTRPGVFFTARTDGALDVWDFFYKQNDPSLTVQITDSALTSLTVQDTGRLVMVGAADGSTTLLELCEGLTLAQPGEKQGVGQIFERETKREKNLELRARELKLKARREGGAAAEGTADDDSRARLAELETDFLAAVGLAPAALAPAADRAERAVPEDAVVEAAAERAETREDAEAS